MGLINLLMPYRIYLLAALAALLVFSGWKVRDWQCDAAYAKALQQSTKIKEKQSAIVNDVSRDYEEKRSKSDAVTVERTNTIREIYRDVPAPAVDCAAPDATRRVLEDSVRDANATATGKSGGALSGSGKPAKPTD